jgi:hypothetical protein
MICPASKQAEPSIQLCLLLDYLINAIFGLAKEVTVRLDILYKQDFRSTALFHVALSVSEGSLPPEIRDSSLRSERQAKVLIKYLFIIFKGNPATHI